MAERPQLPPSHVSVQLARERRASAQQSRTRVENCLYSLLNLRLFWTSDDNAVVCRLIREATGRCDDVPVSEPNNLRSRRPPIVMLNYASVLAIQRKIYI